MKKGVLIAIIILIIVIILAGAGITIAVILKSDNDINNSIFGNSGEKITDDASKSSNIKDETNQNTNKVENNSQNVSSNNQDYEIKLTDMFETNPIKCDKYYYYDGNTKEEKQLEDVFDINDYSYAYSYIQIQGLKDSGVQNKINNSIKDEISKFAKEKGNTETTISANFSNIISLCGETDGGYIGLNYRLDTGDKVNFEDLFIDKSKIDETIRQTAYDSKKQRKVTSVKTGETIINQDVDQSKLDEIASEIVQNYKNTSDLNYWFTESTIYMQINNEIFKIEMPSFYSNIAIYKRFLSNNQIYTNAYNKYRDYVFATNRWINAIFYYKKMEKETNNLLLDIQLYDTWGDATSTTKQKGIQDVNNMINAIKGKVSSDNEHIYLLSGYGMTNDEDSDIEFAIYCIDKNYYNTKGEEFFAKSNRTEPQDTDGLPYWVEYNEFIDDKNAITYTSYIELEGNKIVFEKLDEGKDEKVKMTWDVVNNKVVCKKAN